LEVIGTKDDVILLQENGNKTQTEKPMQELTEQLDIPTSVYNKEN
jgi:chaperonin GroEL